MKRSSCFALAVFLACHSLIGCTGWTVQNQPPQDVMRDQHPDKVRIRLKDGKELILERPSIVGDSLVGAARSTIYLFSSRTPLETWKPAGVPVPIDEIDQLEVMKVNETRTWVLVLLGLPVMAGIIFVVAWNAGYND